MEPYEDMMRRGGGAALEAAGRFFMGDDPVHGALRELTGRLDTLGIPYAVMGGMALIAHGYARTTVDVDVLVTREGLEAAHRGLVGLGYRPVFAKSRHLRDAARGVRIEFLVSGEFPGDGKPKPVAFPDPAASGVEIDGIRYVRLTTLIELKLASGMTNPGRLKDLADVQELIRALGLQSGLEDQLHPYVRDKYRELWHAVRSSEP